MAETLGSLCDKLTIVKLKQYHTHNQERLEHLKVQELQLQDEINSFISHAIIGHIPYEKLVFASCKVYKQQGNEIAQINGTIGSIFSMLASINCQLWHEQEKVYDFEKIPLTEKDTVVKKLALLNLERNQCIETIDRFFQALIKQP